MKGDHIKKYLSYLKPSYLFSSIIFTLIIGTTNSIIIMGFGYNLFIAPFIEELSKLIAITYNFHFAIIYTWIFSIIEFFYYVDIIIDNTGSFTIEDFLLRTFCIIIHFILLFIQIVGVKLFYKTKKKRYFIISFISAFILHSIWNGFLGNLISSFIIQLL